ncbi:MAG: hypothetical protein COT17_01380 [Elusimicrobia bacterium CG08_land_8_20_14_0_20_51_18]|nr:MAG: hypothetical protein COT17_01380 [Elusimicrobia bacterium CG08_land_8_20_14_0_20_51_18]
MKLNKYKFILSVFFFFSLPFFILSTHFLTSINDISKKDMLSYMDFRVKTVSSRISDVLNVKYDALAVAREKKFIDMSLEGKKAELAKIAKNFPEIVNEFSLINGEGKEVFSTLKGKKPGNFKDNGIFKNAKTDSFSVGAVNYPYDAPPELIIAEPLVKTKGEKPRYVLMARLSLGYLNEEISRLVKKTHGNINLVDAGNQIIFDSGYNYLFKAGLQAEDTVSVITDAMVRNNIPSYNGAVNFNGVETLISVSNVDSTAWWIYEKTDVENVIDYRLYKWAQKVIIIGFLLIIVFSYISFKLAVFWLNKPEE